MLVRDYEGLWTAQEPTPAIILEGGPEDWAIWASSQLCEKFKAIGVFAEPLVGFILQLYPAPERSPSP